MIEWKKKTLIYKNSNPNFTHTQLPVSIKLKDRIRIFYSSRDKKGRSYPFYFDLSLDLKKILKVCHKPLLRLGSIGKFDDMGVMPTAIIKVKSVYYLYYIGWNVRKNIPYSNSLGLAVSSNCKDFKKISHGPILHRSNKEPYFFGTAHVIKKNNLFYMFYLSCVGWRLFKKRVEPYYDIKMAQSKNGVKWKQNGKSIIKLKKGEGGISSSSIIKYNNLFIMYYSYRGEKNYRSNKKNSYKIGMAISKNLFNWKRHDKKFNLKLGKKWDSKMMAYPNVIDIKDKHIMFYNGNGFGRSGIGIAIEKKH